ncbi:hypothetical protein [Ferruginibacter profundus]
MALNKNKIEKIITLVIIISGVVLYFVNVERKKNLNSVGVFVLGKLDSSYFVGETGWMYKYRYKFNNQTFYRSINMSVPQEILNDSLMFFKILPSNPNICRQLIDIKVPKCIIFENVPKSGWNSLPLTICDSK